MNLLNWILTTIITLLLIPYFIRMWSSLQNYFTNRRIEKDKEENMNFLNDVLKRQEGMKKDLLSFQGKQETYQKDYVEKMFKHLTQFTDRNYNLIIQLEKELKAGHANPDNIESSEETGIVDKMMEKFEETDKKETKEEPLSDVGVGRDLDGRTGGNFNNPPKEKTREEKQSLQSEKYEKYGREWYLANKERILKKARKTRLQKLREHPNHNTISELKGEYNLILSACHPTPAEILEEVFTSLVGKKVSRHTPIYEAKTGMNSTLHLIKKVEDLQEMDKKLLSDWKIKSERRIYKRRYARVMPQLQKMKKRIIKLTNQIKK